MAGSGPVSTPGSGFHAHSSSGHLMQLKWRGPGMPHDLTPATPEQTQAFWGNSPPSKVIHYTPMDPQTAIFWGNDPKLVLL